MQILFSNQFNDHSISAKLGALAIVTGRVSTKHPAKALLFSYYYQWL